MVVNKIAILKIEEMNASFEQLISNIELYCFNNKEEYITYIRNIQKNSIAVVITKEIINREDIDWISASSRGLPRYFDDVNRNDFAPSFFITLEIIMERMSEIRNEIERLKY